MRADGKLKAVRHCILGGTTYRWCREPYNPVQNAMCKRWDTPQKEPYRSPYEHAPIGLEPGLRLQVIEITVELGHQRQREPHMDNRRRFPFWTAHSLLRRGRFGGQPLASWAVSLRRG
jgi:hypothetical protein